MKRVVLILLWLVIAQVTAVQAFAQTVSWVETDAGATTYTYTLRNGTTVVPIGATTCSSTACSAPITGAVTAGTYTLTATNSVGLSATSAPLVLGAPSAPSGLTITVTTTTTVTTAKPPQEEEEEWYGEEGAK